MAQGMKQAGVGRSGVGSGEIGSRGRSHPTPHSPFPTPLSRFLSAAATRGFAWGRHDCMLFAADWAKALTGVDPAAGWRGTYLDETEARAVLSAAGGPEAQMHRALKRCGWRRIGAGPAAPGDIALAVPPRHADACAGIVAQSGRVALLTRGGLVVWPIPVLAAWRHGAMHG